MKENHNNPGYSSRKVIDFSKPETWNRKDPARPPPKGFPALPEENKNHGLNISCIISGRLYLGARRAAANRTLLSQLGISHVINATEQLPSYFAEKDSSGNAIENVAAPDPRFPIPMSPSLFSPFSICPYDPRDTSVNFRHSSIKTSVESGSSLSNVESHVGRPCVPVSRKETLPTMSVGGNTHSAAYTGVSRLDNTIVVSNTSGNTLTVSTIANISTSTFTNTASTHGAALPDRVYTPITVEATGMLTGACVSSPRDSTDVSNRVWVTRATDSPHMSNGMCMTPTSISSGSSTNARTTVVETEGSPDEWVNTSGKYADDTGRGPCNSGVAGKCVGSTHGCEGSARGRVRAAMMRAVRKAQIQAVEMEHSMRGERRMEKNGNVREAKEAKMECMASEGGNVEVECRGRTERSMEEEGIKAHEYVVVKDGNGKDAAEKRELVMDGEEEKEKVDMQKPEEVDISVCLQSLYINSKDMNEHVMDHALGGDGGSANTSMDTHEVVMVDTGTSKFKRTIASNINTNTDAHNTVIDNQTTTIAPVTTTVTLKTKTTTGNTMSSSTQRRAGTGTRTGSVMNQAPQRRIYYTRVPVFDEPFVNISQYFDPIADLIHSLIFPLPCVDCQHKHTQYKREERCVHGAGTSMDIGMNVSPSIPSVPVPSLAPAPSVLTHVPAPASTAVPLPVPTHVPHHTDQGHHQHCEKCQPKRVFVHCMAGKSRSASLVIAYLIKYGLFLETGKSRFFKFRNFPEVMRYVMTCRVIVQPNPAFMCQLWGYWKLCRLRELKNKR